MACDQLLHAPMQKQQPLAQKMILLHNNKNKNNSKKKRTHTHSCFTTCIKPGFSGEIFEKLNSEFRAYSGHTMIPATALGFFHSVGIVRFGLFIRELKPRTLKGKLPGPLMWSLTFFQVFLKYGPLGCIGITRGIAQFPNPKTLNPKP